MLTGRLRVRSALVLALLMLYVWAVALPSGLMFSSGASQQPSQARRVVYVLRVFDSNASWTNPTEVAGNCTELLRREGSVEVRQLDYVGQLVQLVRQPEDDVIVINTHGETIPYDELTLDWQDFYRAVARNIVEHGWIWINTVGYPFYYYSRNASVNTAVEGSGLVTFLSVLSGVSADVGGGELDGYATEEARRLNATFHAGLRERLNATRSVVMTGLEPFRVYYRGASEGRYAAAAFGMGRGVFVPMGLDWSEDQGLVGRLAAAIALDIGVGPYVSIRALSYDAFSGNLKVTVEAANFSPERLETTLSYSIGAQMGGETGMEQVSLAPLERKSFTLEANVYSFEPIRVDVSLDVQKGRYMDRARPFYFPIPLIVPPILAVVILVAVLLWWSMRRRRKKT